MTDYTIPRANAPIAGQEAPTVQWYNYLRSVGAISTASNAALLQDITTISDKLGSPDGTPENIPTLSNITDIQGIGSVVVTGANIKQISLINDAVVVSPVSLYGTNSSGIKGWHLVGDAFANSANIVKTVTAGIVSFDLTTLTDIGGGTLQKTAFDSYGRKTGTSAATTSDLAEGTNLYFTASRVLATLLSGLSTATSAAITAADSVILAFGKLQAQITTLASSLTGYVPTSRTISTTAPLTGGGDLSANRTLALANTAVTPASYGDATHVATFTVDAQGRLTAAASVAISGGSAVSSVFGRTGAIVSATGDYLFSQIGSTPTTLSGYGITDGALATTTISAGAGLSGGGSLAANRTLSIANTTVTAASYGDATHVPTFTVNAQGQLTAAAASAIAFPSGNLLNVRVFSTPGSSTYTPTTGTKSIIVEVQGAGGGGGGTAATTAAQLVIAGGGGSGAYAKSYLTTGFSGATITIGAGGAGGAAGTNTGATGGASSFGALISCNGGGGGVGGTATAATSNSFAQVTGATAIATGGNIINSSGSSLGYGMQVQLLALSGSGNSSNFGGGGKGIVVASSAGNASGSIGAGGGGACGLPSASSAAGGGGGGGAVIIHEYS